MENRNSLTDRQKKAFAIASLAIFILLSAAIGWFIGRPMVKFVSEPIRFREWVDAHGVMGRLAYVGMVFLQVFIAIIPGEPLEIGGGYAFGTLEGTLLCMAGASIGSLLVFLFVRKLGVRLVEVFFPKEKIQSLRFLQSSPKRDFLFFLIFMIPGTPKDLLCYFAGLTDISLKKWILISSLGRIPSIITSTVGGDALGLKQYSAAIITLAVTLALSLAGLLVYRAICRRHAQAATESAEAPEPLKKK